MEFILVGRLESEVHCTTHDQYISAVMRIAATKCELRAEVEGALAVLDGTINGCEMSRLRKLQPFPIAEAIEKGEPMPATSVIVPQSDIGPSMRAIIVALDRK